MKESICAIYMEVLLFLYFLTSASARLIVYSPEAVRDEFKSRYYHGELNYSLGNFGNPPYGSELKGRVFFDSSNALGCSPFEKPPEDWSYFSNSILLVKRGDCYFVTKVSNAESIGAKAVLIVDNVEEPVSSIIMVDNGAEGNLSIPALLISKSDGQVFIDHMDGEEETWISISFHLRPSGKSIDYTLWTSSENEKSLKFLRNFTPTANSFTAKQAKFTPRYVLHESSSEEDIPTHCISGGKYCAPYKIINEVEIKGRDIIMEDLRRLCIYNITAGEKTYEKWFNYHLHLSEGCVNNINPSGCSDLAMNQAGVSKSAVEKCIQNSVEGDDIDVDDNYLLKLELEAYRASYIHQYPALYINGVRYRGDLEEEPVLLAMCDSFSESKPKICKQFEDEIEPKKGGSKWAILVLAIFCLTMIIVIFLVYRMKIRRELSEEMKAQVNSSVSQYFALSDNIEMRKNDR